MKYSLAKELARPPRPAERAESPLWDASGKRAPRIPFGDGSPRKSSPSVERAAAARAEVLLESGRSSSFWGRARNTATHPQEREQLRKGWLGSARSSLWGSPASLSDATAARATRPPLVWPGAGAHRRAAEDPLEASAARPAERAAPTA